MLCGAALTTIVWALALASPGVDAAAWRLPLQRHPITPRDAALDRHYQDLSKSGFPWQLRVPSLARGGVWGQTIQGMDDRNGDVITKDFTNTGDSTYVAELFVGTPAQRVSLALDIMTADTLVFNHKVGRHEFYDHAKSTTYHANGTQIVLNADTPFEIDGFVSNDHIAVVSENDKRLEVRNQPFIELTGSDSILDGLHSLMDGAIGLGPQRGRLTGQVSFMRSMINQGLLDQPVVGLHLGEKNAHVSFGAIDAKYKDTDITYFTGTQRQQGGWWSAMSGVRVGEKPVVATETPAILFGSLDFVLGPQKAVEALADAVGAENFALPCDGPGPDVTLQLGTLEITLTKKEYAIPVGKGMCQLAFYPIRDDPQSGPVWALGMPLLRRVYMVLDYGSAENKERVGLAQLKD